MQRRFPCQPSEMFAGKYCFAQLIDFIHRGQFQRGVRRVLENSVEFATRLGVIKSG